MGQARDIQVLVDGVPIKVVSFQQSRFEERASFLLQINAWLDDEDCQKAEQQAAMALVELERDLR